MCDHSDDEDMVLPLHSNDRICKTRDIFLNRKPKKPPTQKQSVAPPLSNNDNSHIDFHQLRVEQKNQYPWNSERENYYKIKAGASKMLQQKLSEIRLNYKNELNNATLQYESRISTLEAAGNAAASRAIERCESIISQSVESLVSEFNQHSFPSKPEQELRFERELKRAIGQKGGRVDDSDDVDVGGNGDIDLLRFKRMVNANLDITDDSGETTNETTVRTCLDSPSRGARSNWWRENRAAVAADSAVKASGDNAIKLSPNRDLVSSLTKRINSIEAAVLTPLVDRHENSSGGEGNVWESREGKEG